LETEVRTLKEAVATSSSALEERMRQRDREIAALQTELLRVQESVAEAEVSALRSTALTQLQNDLEKLKDSTEPTITQNCSSDWKCDIPFLTCALIRSKLARNQSIVAQYGQTGLFTKFFTKAITIDTSGSILAGTALVERIAQVRLHPSLQVMIDNGKMTETTNVYGNLVVQQLFHRNDGCPPINCARIP
jgi:CRISPR/Cas system-associated endoribonuclease Cas2